MSTNPKQTKRDFGSFHASNVQELLSLPAEKYDPPQFPQNLHPPHFSSQNIDFGKSFRSEHFFLEETCTFLNHGAFGAVMKEVLIYAQRWQRYVEEQPLRFFDRELLPHLVYVTRRLADFVGCKPTDLILMNNATTAINTAVHNIPLIKGDIIYCLNLTYGAVKKLLKWTCDQNGAVLQEETVTFPLSGAQQIISLVMKTLKPGTKLAVFDHIPSNSPVILPVKELIDICHRRNVKVLIDGAHALGSIPLNLHDLNPDFYVSNGHKWFCCPKGCAFMYVKSDMQCKTRPLIISHGFGSGFNSEFIWTGLHDYSPFLGMHAMINFWEDVGVDRITTYINDLQRNSSDILMSKWKTHKPAPDDMFGTMCLVELPKSVYKNKECVDYNAAEEIQNRLFHTYCIEVPIKSIQGVLYVRLSCHLYNYIDEYEKLGDAILTMANANKEDKSSFNN